VRPTASERSGESELLEPRGVRKDVDRDDPAVRDGEAHHRVDPLATDYTIPAVPFTSAGREKRSNVWCIRASRAAASAPRTCRETPSAMVARGTTCRLFVCHISAPRRVSGVRRIPL